MVNASDATYAGPFIGVNNRYYRHEFTEEVRATSDFKGPLNYTLGGLYEDGFFSDHVTVLGNTADTFPGTNSTFRRLWRTAPPPSRSRPARYSDRSGGTSLIDSSSHRGVRWTDETRSEDPYDPDPLTGMIVPTPVAEPSLHYDNTSPEVTLTYRPTDDLTLYGAYKQGFKSGSFSTATPPTVPARTIRSVRRRCGAANSA